MSLILDALNRARDESNPIPGLATHHPVEMVSAERRQYLLWVALAVAVVVIAWLVMEKYSPSLPTTEIAPQQAERAAVTDDQAVAASKAITAGNAQDPSTPVQVTTSTVATAESVPKQQTAEPVEVPVAPQQTGTESVDVQTIDDSPEPALADASRVDAFFADGAQDMPVEQDNTVAPLAPSPLENDAVAQLYENPELLDEPVPTKRTRQSSAPGAPGRADTSGAQAAGETIDIDKILTMAREEAANASLGDHPVPFLIDLSQQIKDSIPTVYYLRHDYSSDASQSSVVLNSKTLKVGGSPAAGMKIEEILPDSVVLNYQGTQFRLRALNSWVNL